jgi:cellulose synthase/poly-beta-1,6-N-acetylglucosamine synthase-like glycosyltransferase
VDEALASILAQTLQAFEVLVVDDGSIDRTPHLLAEWALQDSRIRVVTTPREGIVTALNRAAAEAQGTFFARMDADDIAHPERLERQIEHLAANPTVGACGTRVRYVPRSILRDGTRRYEKWINSVVTPAEIERDLFVECPIPHPSLVVRRQAFETAGGYRDLGWPEDYDLILRLWEAGYGLGKVSEVLLNWRERPDRLSRSDPRYGEDAFRRCKAHFIGRRVAGRPIVVWGAGPVGKAFASSLRDEGHEVVAFIDLDPRKIGQTIHSAPVIHPSAIGDYVGTYVVAAVGSKKARTEIRISLHAAGFREPEDCCAVA